MQARAPGSVAQASPLTRQKLLEMLSNHQWPGW